MQKIPAYILFMDGKVKVFVANYDNLDDLKRDPEYPAEFYKKWWDMEDGVLYLRRRTEAEWREYRRDHKRVG